MTPTLFSQLGLSAELEKAIQKLGFEQASPIQAAAIPVLLAGTDVVGQSQTGSGKTAAFAIPAIEQTDPKQKQVQVLILCPTRELAVQVSEEVHKLAAYKRGIHPLPIYGGQSYERQFAGLRQGAQIVIGTPGRVMDHLRRGTLQLDALRTIILDEADVMLDMGFREDIEEILQQLPEVRQTVFFSATMPTLIRRLIEKYANQPETIAIQQTAMTVPTVDQMVFEVERRLKVELLTRLIDLHDLKLGIIFCNTKAMVDELVEHLVAQGYQADRLHGDMSQPQRDRVMNRFRRSGLEFLVETDVAARGIDVDDVEVVFNYDLPYDPEDYVHRIGRTGRAGRSGLAISFVAGREIFKIRNIERFTKTRMRRGKLPSRQDVDAARDDHVLKRVRKTLQGDEFRVQEHLIERLLDEDFSSTDIAAALLHELQAVEGNVTSREGRDELMEHAEELDRRRQSRSQRDGYGARRSREPRRRSFERGEEDRRGGRVRSERSSRPSREPRSTVRRPAAKDGDFIPRKDRPTRGTTDTKRAAPKRSEAPKVVRPKPAAKAEKAEKAARVEKPAKSEKPVKTEKSAKAEKSATPFKGTDIRLSIGREAGVTTAQIRDAILGETGIDARALGKMKMESHSTVVGVPADLAKSTVAKLKRAKIGGKRIKARVL